MSGNVDDADGAIAGTARLTAAEARKLIRGGADRPTTGWAAGCTQANLVAVPSDWAYDVLLFAQRNPQPCPVLDVTDPGSPTTVLAPGADLRTDLPRYRIWRAGELVEERADVTTLWTEHLVAFLLGCSFTFETALAAAGIPLRHIERHTEGRIEAGRNVPMYRTTRQCRPAGRLHGPLVVSMRPIPAGLVDTAGQVTAAMPAAHGAPVHIGDPAALGIADLGDPDFGDPVDLDPGDIPVFWACGVTAQAVLMASSPPFAITHSPGRMFITDVRDS